MDVKECFLDCKEENMKQLPGFKDISFSQHFLSSIRLCII